MVEDDSVIQNLIICFSNMFNRQTRSVGLTDMISPVGCQFGYRLLWNSIRLRGMIYVYCAWLAYSKMSDFNCIRAFEL